MAEEIQSIREQSFALLEKLESEGALSRSEFIALLKNKQAAIPSEKRDDAPTERLFQRARNLREQYYGKSIYIRGLIEFTNYCRNDCYYCGIRASNSRIRRYRLSPEEILDCCEKGYALGFRTFVLQGGEDALYTAEKITDLVERIKKKYPDCAVALSVGEQPREVYRRWFDAGADRYLLRHETADDAHYRYLHPASLSLENRKRCLFDLKEIGYQTGCGFMVGSPGQKAEHLAEDLLFIYALQPDMVGIGPFIPQRDTPFGREPAGSLEMTLFLLGILRVMLPNVLLPATTALGTLHPHGLEMGMLAGANVCMPNLTPENVRKQYALYDRKAGEKEDGEGADEALLTLKKRMEAIGAQVEVSRGDAVKITRAGLLTSAGNELSECLRRGI